MGVFSLVYSTRQCLGGNVRIIRYGELKVADCIMKNAAIESFRCGYRTAVPTGISLSDICIVSENAYARIALARSSANS